MARFSGLAFFSRHTRALRDFLTTTAAALALCYFGTTQAPR